MTNISQSRQDPIQEQRITNLFEILPKNCNNVLEIGARDGHLSLLLTQHFNSVYALDLELPSISHEKIICVKGDVTQLDFDDNFFDVTFCTEVLEHIPKELLSKACDELTRVSSKYIVIGVPYKQDLRSGETTCPTCHKSNPPWGHINSFSKEKLVNLFRTVKPASVNFVGTNNDKTNFISHSLMKIAGNPYGTYIQDEHCIYCDSEIHHSNNINIIQFLIAKTAALITKIQRKLSIKKQANWIHIIFEK